MSASRCESLYRERESGSEAAREGGRQGGRDVELELTFASLWSFSLSTGPGKHHRVQRDFRGVRG